MSGNEYVKYVTQQITTYLDTPAAEKKLKRIQKKSQPTIFSSRWLGILPFAFKLFIKRTQ
ncbi:YqzE family protein [Virgibacillus doumboii]|uniref:YqzE family protein n=1 Tax=Virgibacillus doumboii TaxID=2697503 RepID=UPI0013DFB784|nr:YqzE family protein [Virgibacillus doumboii]